MDRQTHGAASAGRVTTAIGQGSTAPLLGLLQEREEFEEPGRGLEHVLHSASRLGPKLS